MIEPSDKQLRSELILASAYFHGRKAASCANVLKHALHAAGLWNDAVREAAGHSYYGRRPEDTQSEIPHLWYLTLIELTRTTPGAEHLLNGAGNLDYPAGAAFTACWLTGAGKRVSKRLLAERPTWRNLLTAAM